MPTLALIDGNSIAYRAFYALPEDLATKSGQVTNAVFGFTRMLIRLLKDYHPDGIAVAWDVSRQTFRTESYPEYKAQREKAPDHFRSQLPLMDEVLQTLDITQLREEGFEADDIIATLTRNGTAAGWEILIVTGDRDAFQLIEKTVKVVYTRRGISDIVLADEEYVEEKYGIRPDQYVEYAALRGDTSDNLPGVPGVGEKTASRLIAEHGDLDNLFLSVTDLTPKLKENLSAHREQVFLNRELMQLVDDMDLGVEIEDLRTREWDRNQVKDLFDSLEFHSMWNDLEQALPSAATVSELVEVESSLLTSPEQGRRHGADACPDRRVGDRWWRAVRACCLHRTGGGGRRAIRRGRPDSRCPRERTGRPCRSRREGSGAGVARSGPRRGSAGHGHRASRVHRESVSTHLRPRGAGGSSARFGIGLAR